MQGALVAAALGAVLSDRGAIRRGWRRVDGLGASCAVGSLGFDANPESMLEYELRYDGLRAYEGPSLCVRVSNVHGR